jgi:hypothetical protein
MNENTMPEQTSPSEPLVPIESIPTPLPPEPTPVFSNYPPQQKRTFPKAIYGIYAGIALIVLILGLYLSKTKASSLQTSVTTNQPAAIQLPSNCQLYAVAESGDNDSQIVTIDPKTKTLTPLGDLQKHMQIENIAYDLRTKTLFANSSNLGQIYVIDYKTGIFSLVGTAHSGEITAFTIHPTGTQWGWAKEDGLIEIKLREETDTHLYPSLKRGSALTWNTEGTLLYGTYKDNTELFTYDTTKNTYSPLAYNLPTATRGLSSLSGNILLGINSETEGTIHIYEFDPVQKLVTKELTLETPGSEPRGIAWDPDCGDPL